jgi:hypothetical protein
MDALRGVDRAPMVSYVHLCAATSLVVQDPAESLIHAREALRIGARFPMTAAWPLPTTQRGHGQSSATGGES